MCNKTCGCDCESKCNCHKSYMDVVCPEGFEASGCILYNGDVLKDLADADYIYSNTSLNTVIKQMWVKILEGGGGSSNLTQLLSDVNTLKTQMTTVIANIGNLTTLTTTAKGNLVAAINEIDADLTALTTLLGNLSTLNNLPGVTTQATTFVGAINDRQPVWKKSTTVTVGASQPAPFNNLETAIAELAKYHSSNYTISLEDGTYTVTSAAFHQPLSLNRYVDFIGASGNAANVIITSNLSSYTLVSGVSRISLQNLTIKNTGTGGCMASVDSAYIYTNNVNFENSSTSTTSVLLASKGQLHLNNCKITNKATAATHIILANAQSNVYLGTVECDNQGSADAIFITCQVESKASIYYNKPGTSMVSNVATVLNTYLNSQITFAPYHTMTFNNIKYAFVNASDNCDVIVRAQDVSGTNLNITINGLSLTAGGTGSSVFNVYRNSRITSTSLTANTFYRGGYIFANSNFTGDVVFTNMTHGVWLDRNCRAVMNGSISTNNSHGLAIYNNSDVVTDNLQITGQTTAGLNKVIMVNASRLSRNSATGASNIGNDILFSGAGNVVTG